MKIDGSMRFAVFVVAGALVRLACLSPVAASGPLWTVLSAPPRGGSTTSLTDETPPDVNPLVVAAPVVAAAVCRDGIVLLAGHAAAAGSLLSPTDRSSEAITPPEQPTVETSLLQDLDVDFAGPFRIQSMDRQGTTLLTVGWRPDADLLTRAARRMVADEREVLGTLSVLPPQVLAAQVAGVLAELALVGQYRALNCVAILASPTSSGGGSLCLVDVTGVYPVRAVAVGGGSHARSTALQRRLQGIDWSQLSAEEGLRLLRKLVEEERREQEDTPLWVETAIVDTSQNKLLRKGLTDT